MNDWAVRLARFARSLRDHGVGTTLRDELDAAEAMGLVDGTDREETRTTLRIALKIRRPAFDTFDRLFSAFWSGNPEPSPADLPLRPPRSHGPKPRSHVLRWDPDTRRMLDGADDQADGEQPDYSPDAVLRRKPFDEIRTTGRDFAAMERILMRLARRLSTKRSRRLIPTRSRGRPDLRSSLRRALRTSGEMVTFARRTHAVEKPRLTFLCDTSGSMDTHTRFLLMFILSVRRVVPKAEIFAFNTELTRLTPLLGRGEVGPVLRQLSARVAAWSGGTRIGESLSAFAEEHLEQRVGPTSVVVIVSDGLDRGDPSTFANALRAIRRRARKVVWLNPLLGDPRYEPLTGGMRAALPFIDHFASAHNAESLERVLPHLAGRS